MPVSGDNLGAYVPECYSSHLVFQVQWNLSYPGSLGPEGAHNLENAHVSEMYNNIPLVFVGRKLFNIASLPFATDKLKAIINWYLM